jgi:hypothetical protein
MTKRSTAIPSIRQSQGAERSSCASSAICIAGILRELIADGFDGDDLLVQLNERLPGITFQEFVGALLLHRAETGVPGYLLGRPGGCNDTLNSACRPIGGAEGRQGTKNRGDLTRRNHR